MASSRKHRRLVVRSSNDRPSWFRARLLRLFHVVGRRHARRRLRLGHRHRHGRGWQRRSGGWPRGNWRQLVERRRKRRRGKRDWWKRHRRERDRWKRVWHRRACDRWKRLRHGRACDRRRRLRHGWPRHRWKRGWWRFDRRERRQVRNGWRGERRRRRRGRNHGRLGRTGRRQRCGRKPVPACLRLGRALLSGAAARGDRWTAHALDLCDHDLDDDLSRSALSGRVVISRRRAPTAGFQLGAPGGVCLDSQGPPSYSFEV